MLLLLLAGAMLATPASAQSGGKPINVLFIGDSFTYTNDLPGMFGDIARSKGAPLGEIAMIGEGNEGLKEHAQDPVTRQRLEEERWDVVVLQERSPRPSLETKQTERLVFPYGKALVEMIRKANPSANIVFLETWAGKDGDASNCGKIPAVCTYAGMQGRLSSTYIELARRNRTGVARVGTAWARARRKRTNIELYAADGVLPSAQGSYLAACVLYEQAFNRSSMGALAAYGVTNDEAEELQGFVEK